MKTYNYKNGNLTASVKDADVKKGIVTGYFASFGNVDSDGDIIVKGAFSKTISETGPGSAQPRIKHLMNHDTSKPLGRLMMLEEDMKGLKYESQTGSHSLGVDFMKMVDSGLITEHSIGYRVIKKNQLQDWEGYMKNPAKGYQELTELQLWEGSSLTAWGANQNTPLTGVKSLDIEQINTRIKALDKFCRNSTATDETIELLLIEIKQLQQHLIDATQPEKPVESDEEKAVETIKQFLQTLNAK